MAKRKRGRMETPYARIKEIREAASSDEANRCLGDGFVLIKAVEKREIDPLGRQASSIIYVLGKLKSNGHAPAAPPPGSGPVDIMDDTPRIDPAILENRPWKPYANGEGEWTFVVNQDGSPVAELQPAREFLDRLKAGEDLVVGGHKYRLRAKFLKRYRDDGPSNKGRFHVQPASEAPAQAVGQKTSWRERANAELDRIVQLFSTTQLPDLCAKALISAPEKPSSKWSLGNQILMLLAGTTDARGYRQWQETGRHVRQGSKAFHILGPVYTKKQIQNTCGSPVGVEEDDVLAGFRAIPVFRQEDTDGADLPEYEPRAQPPLLEVAERFGMKVNYLRLSAGVLGMTDYERKVITLATEDWTVFWHELAHAIHRSYEPKTSHGREPEAEAVAQLVAATLARLYGKPDDGFSWAYLATQADSASPQQVGRLCMRVLDRAKKVLDLIYRDTSASETPSGHHGRSPVELEQTAMGSPRAEPEARDATA